MLDRALVQSNSLVALRISSGFAFSKNQTVFSEGGGYKIDTLNFAKTTWWYGDSLDVKMNRLLIPWLNFVET